MSSIIKVNTYQDANGNALFSSDGSGNVTTSASGLQNTPAFQATMSANQTITANTYTKVDFDTEDFDTDSAYDHSTNQRFTVPSGKGGKYFIYIHLIVDVGSSGGDSMDVLPYINGVASTKIGSFTRTISSTIGNNTIQCSGILTLSPTDYVEAFCILEASTAIRTSRTQSRSSFTMYKLIGA